MKYLLSVDGGGTKTEFCLYCIDTGERKSFRAKSSNYKSTGVESLHAALEEGMKWINGQQIVLQEIECAVFGMSGCDSDFDYKVIRKEIIKVGFQEETLYLCNDGVLGFYAQTMPPGIAVTSGTGSIVIGVNKDGKCIRCGGWGYHFSDIGSGYWIGKEALKRTLLYCDGCEEYSMLYNRIRRHYQAESFKELPYLITQIQDCPRLADIAILVVEAAQQGISEAILILRDGFSMLACQIQSVYKKMNLPEQETLKLVFSGGVMKSQYCRNLLEHEVRCLMKDTKIEILEAENPAVEGGFNYYFKMAK